MYCRFSKQGMKLRLAALTVAALVILLSGTVATARNLTPEQMGLIKWMTYYYQHKDVAQVPGKFVELSKAGLLDFESQYSFLGFASTVFVDNPDMIPDWMMIIDDLPREHRKNLYIALWLSNTEKAKQALSQPERRAILLEKNRLGLNTQKRPIDMNRLPTNPYYLGAYMDMQWGRFMASGEKRPVELVASVLKFGKYFFVADKYRTNKGKPTSEKEKNEYAKSIALRTAMWSLKSNAEQHPGVLRYCQEIHADDSADKLVRDFMGVVLSRVSSAKQ